MFQTTNQMMMKTCFPLNSLKTYFSNPHKLLALRFGASPNAIQWNPSTAQKASLEIYSNYC